MGIEEKLNKARVEIVALKTALATKEEESAKAKQAAELAVNSRNKLAAEFDKQKVELAAKYAEVETLITKVTARDNVVRDLKAAEWAAKEKAEKALEKYQSSAYVATIIAEFQNSDAYKDAITAASYGYLK